MITLDACKAFDVVWQDSLLRKIKFNINGQGKLWFTIGNMYSQARSVVKSNGRTSSHFEIRQGVRRGGKLSALIRIQVHVVD